MVFDNIEPGNSVPDDINVVIEVPAHSGPVKYEIDKDSGALTVDRLMNTPMHYPCNYGFVPRTLSDDGDPVDVLVVTPVPLTPGCVIRARPVGVLKMRDEAGEDAKIVAVPVQKLSSLYDNVASVYDLPQGLRDAIAHFFENYKDLDKGKWVEIDGWDDRDAARREIEASAARFPS